MKILITNDDGINADGLVRLAMVAKEFGEVCVVAPMHQQSANSHSLTLSRSLTMRKNPVLATGGLAGLLPVIWRLWQAFRFQP